MEAWVKLVGMYGSDGPAIAVVSESWRDLLWNM